MRKPTKNMAVKISWRQYKRLKDEALDKDKPISKLLSEKLDQVYEAEQKFECDVEGCDFEAKTEASLKQHKTKMHG